MTNIIEDFISDDPELPRKVPERLFYTGWENVVFRLDDGPSTHPAPETVERPKATQKTSSMNR